MDTLIGLIGILWIIVSWIINNFGALIAVIIIGWIIWKYLLKPITDEFRTLIQKLFEKLNRIEEIGEAISELSLYDEVSNNRRGKVINLYIDFLIKNEKLSKKTAEAKANFIVSEFGSLDALISMRYDSPDPLEVQKNLREFELIKSNEFVKEISNGFKPKGDEVYLNIRNLWSMSPFKYLLGKNKKEEIILREKFNLGSSSWYPESYSDYKSRKIEIQILEDLGIIKKIKDETLFKGYEDRTFMRKREFVFTTLDINEIKNLIFKNKDEEIPDDKWIEKQLKIKRERLRPILEITDKGESLPYYGALDIWCWLYIDYSHEDEY